MTLIELILRYQFKRSRLDLLLDLIYVHNSDYRLEPHVVKFPPEAIELDIRPDILDDENTFISAVVDRNFDYRLDPSNTGFLYRRIPLAALKNSTGHEIVPPALPFKTYDILDQINEQLQTELTEDDLENLEYTTLQEYLTIKAKPGAWNWIGWREIDVVGAGPKLRFYDQVFLNGLNDWTE